MSPKDTIAALETAGKAVNALVKSDEETTVLGLKNNNAKMVYEGYRGKLASERLEKAIMTRIKAVKRVHA